MILYPYVRAAIGVNFSAQSKQIKTQYVYDVRGSVIQTVIAKAYRELSEATAAPTVTVQGCAYTPYGEQIGTKINGYTYNGEYYDAAAGYEHARIYAIMRRGTAPVANASWQRNTLITIES